MEKYQVYLKAVTRGHVPVLEYMGPYHDEHLFSYAIVYNQLESFKWLIENMQAAVDMRGNLMLYNRLDFIQYLHTKRMLGGEWCNLAAQHGRLEILKWLRQEGYPWTSQVIRVADIFGHHDLVMWAIENGCPIE